MKSGKPALRKPPQNRPMDPALANLLKADAWTQTPAEQAASDAGLAGAGEGAPAEDTAVIVQLSETIDAGAREQHGRQLTAGSEIMPWEAPIDMTRPEVVRPRPVVRKEVPRQAVTYRFPIPLLQALNWLGGTSYGENMTSIVIQALEDEVNARLIALGKPPIQRSTPDRKLRKLPKP